LSDHTRLGVLGWPVKHSRSPAMQNAALRAAGLPDWRYQLLPVAPELFPETVRALRGAGFRGANVTIPHKEAALAVAHDSAQRAREIGAANTLLFTEDGSITAENTDAPGLIAALPFSPRGRSALVLGAGGSARAAVWALLDGGAAEVLVWNRTAERAARVCAELGAVAVRDCPAAELLINCTSSGLDTSDSTFKQLPLGADDLLRYRCVVDFVYSERETELVREARARSLEVVDGLELLIAQGALAFELFTGLAAPVHAMRSALGRDD
jgi:shikimate dehydrogenase